MEESPEISGDRWSSGKIPGEIGCTRSSEQLAGSSSDISVKSNISAHRDRITIAFKETTKMGVKKWWFPCDGSKKCTMPSGFCKKASAVHKFVSLHKLHIRHTFFFKYIYVFNCIYNIHTRYIYIFTYLFIYWIIYLQHTYHMYNYHISLYFNRSRDLYALQSPYAWTMFPIYIYI